MDSVYNSAKLTVRQPQGNAMSLIPEIFNYSLKIDARDQRPPK